MEEGGWGWIFRGIVWIMVRCAMLVGWTIQKTYLFIFRTTATVPAKQTRTQVVAENDARRVSECERVAGEYLRYFGYIAREAMNRDELLAKIKTGISPDDLNQELQSRIQKVPGIVLGTYSGTSAEVKLPLSWRQRHVYIVGRSGAGKTNLIKNMLHQDLRLGSGIGVLAPELELLTEGVLPYVPDNRIDDVVFVNPADKDHPIPFNPLFVDTDENVSEKVSDLVTIFKRVVGDTGARMDYILRRSLYALMERPGSTLLDIERLLSPFNNRFRQEVIQTSKDDRVISFFTQDFPRLSKDATLPIISRLDEFIHSDIIRAFLCQPGKSFNFRQAMDDGKILLFNLSDGLLGPQNARLLGQIIVSKIQLALMSRADTPSAVRRPFYLYLDEFQAFVWDNKEAYSTILSRARKYAFGLTLAHQQTGQLSRELLHEILGNVSTVLTLSVSAEDAKRLSQEYRFEGEPIPPHEFLSLRTGQAIGKIDTNVFPLTTYLADDKPDFTRAKLVVDRSRQNYADGGNGGKGTGGTSRQPRPPRKPLPPGDKPDPDEVFE
jgi:hypothetical protein